MLSSDFESSLLNTITKHINLELSKFINGKNCEILRNE